MQKLFFLLGIIVLIAACSSHGKKVTNSNTTNKEFAIYSKSVQDSFIIFIQLPENYYDDTGTKYPAVYLLDANFHFPIVASIVSQYGKAGLLPPLILIGIGYTSFQLMDSLRQRDYMYPAALPSDEITAVGGGKNFDDFIINQLVPYIDSNYNTDKTSRSLLGHSFGGYFSLYALLNQVENNRPIFKNFGAASPSLWYNNFYLNQLTGKLKNRADKDTLNIFLTAGGLEDSTWNVAPVKNLANKILTANVKNINFQYRIYSELKHMDVSTITFIKALQEFYKTGK